MWCEFNKILNVSVLNRLLKQKKRKKYIKRQLLGFCRWATITIFHQLARLLVCLLLPTIKKKLARRGVTDATTRHNMRHRCSTHCIYLLDSTCFYAASRPSRIVALALLKYYSSVRDRCHVLACYGAGKPALCSPSATNSDCAPKTPCSPAPTATALLPCKSTPKVKKVIYDITENDDFDREMIATYEEVARLYPRPGLVRPIVLVGAPGVGRNELRRRLIATDPEKYVTPVPCKALFVHLKSLCILSFLHSRL